MTIVIVVILLLGYVVMATEHLTNISKAAVAMFLCVVGWTLYMLEGTDYVMAQHAPEYLAFLNGRPTSVELIKTFIAENIFMKYIADVSQVVLFLLATMYIVEVLDNNNCFDFLAGWLRTRNSKKLMWALAFTTFIFSANLDNLTSACMMFAVMHKLVQNNRLRLAYGSVIVVAANAGGCFTVIGDPTSLMLWMKQAVTPSVFSSTLALPAIVACAVPTYLVSRTLPDHLDYCDMGSVYRGDDSALNYWQRILMLLVGIGGLWFIPTFHNLTKLPMFVGALCVLGLLWIVNELCNRKVINSDTLTRHNVPQFVQYTSIQTILFVIGIVLALGSIKETGALSVATAWCDEYIHNAYLYSVVMGLFSAVLDNVALVATSITMFPVLDATSEVAKSDPAYFSAFMQNGTYWELTSFCGSVGGSLLTIGSLAGYALMKIEGATFSWYVKRMTWKVLLGWLLGLGVFFVIHNFFI